jgi:hypothetical protein
MPPEQARKRRMTAGPRAAFAASLARAACAVVLGAAAGLATAQSFEHKDWQLACDNTRTCRAAGYQPDGGDAPPVSVLLTRAAGPGTPVDGELQLGTMDDDAPRPGSVRVAVGGQAVGTVKLDGDGHGVLPAAVTQALLKALAGTAAIAFSGGGTTWRLSGEGAAAVLLKMDDLQGRVGTPSALVRKGTAPETGVKPPLPAPVVRAVRVAKAPRPGDDALAARIVATLRHVPDCDLLDDADAHRDPSDAPALWHLDATRVLVTAPCWRAAYNAGDGYWVANATPPYDPVLVTASGTDFDEATGISSQQKGRGIADCLGEDAWTWDGRAFVHTRETTTGMCRGVVAGGAWDLPTRVARVIPAK